MTRGLRGSVVAVLGVTLALIPATASAQGWTCESSALAATIGPSPRTEPITANKGESTCKADSDGGAFPPSPLPITGSLLSATTDLQPPTAVLLTQATGTSSVNEAIFEDRLEWLGEVRRMGANVEMLDAHHATIRGPALLTGAEVEIGDLRAGASLILAALAADGTTTIHGAHHVHRGYENIERKFLDLGANISRSAEGTTDTPS